MYKMLYIANWFDPFLSEWGVWSHSSESGEVWLPLGWEDELTGRGIEFVEVELELPPLTELTDENE
jgi:hypothetical protein